MPRKAKPKREYHVETIEEVTIGKSDSLAIRVSLARVNGVPLVGIRECYRRPDGTVTPNYRGLTIGPAALDDLVKALEQLRGAAVRLGILRVGDHGDDPAAAFRRDPEAV